MLYSTGLTINGKEYRVKFANREIIKCEEAGIDISGLEEGAVSIKDLLFIMHTAIKDLKKADGNEMTFDEFVDFTDDSDVTIEEMSDALEKAVELGLNKGKNKDDDKKK